MKEKHYCLQCGKEIPSWKKFCSKSCAAKYNNKRKIRKPWTEEQKKNVSDRYWLSTYGFTKEEFLLRKATEKQHLHTAGSQCETSNSHITLKPGKCKYCGCEIYKNSACSRCSPYIERLKSYEKLELDGPLYERDRKLHKAVSDMYLSGMSIADMYRKYKLHNVTVKRILVEEGIELRTLSEEQKRNVEKGVSRNHSIKGTHTSWEGLEFRYRSFWEDRYMSELDSEKIRYLYEPFRIRYFDTVDNTERVAIPDFYLPETNEIVELKSYWTIKGQVQLLKDKFARYRELGYTPKLLLDWKFQDLNNLDALYTT